VLLLDGTNKSTVKWRGPYNVVDKKGPVNYRIEVENGMQKVYHMHMLKEFVRRDELLLKTGHRRLETENKDVECNKSEDTNEQNSQSDMLSKIEVDQEESEEEIEESVAAACVIDDTDEQNIEVQILKKGINMELQYSAKTYKDVHINKKLREDQKNRLKSWQENIKTYSRMCPE